MGVLSGLRVSTYRNGVATGESATGTGVLELRLLPDGQVQVSFPTKLLFDEVKIERVGALTALDNLRLYYGFGVEPRRKACPCCTTACARSTWMAAQPSRQ